jgi:hypothetical protein
MILGTAQPKQLWHDRPIARSAVFVFDRENWCYVFGSAAEAEGNLEAADVEADEYVALDQDGRVFQLEAKGIDIRFRPTEVRDPQQLRDRLARFTREWKIESESDHVIDIGNAILEAAWEDRWPKRPRWLARRMHGSEPPRL